MLSALWEELPMAEEAPVESLEGACLVLRWVVVSCEELKDESILFLTIKFTLGIPGIRAKVSWAVRDVCP